jgi:hypothetical protein
LKAIAPEYLLELGPNSTVRSYIEKVKFPGEITGGESAIYFGASQNLVHTDNGVNTWPYYGTSVSVSGAKNDEGVAVINQMNLKGSFYPVNNKPFKRGSRKEVRDLISALCRIMGKPQLQVRKRPISELRYISSDGLVWTTPNATIWLYFEKHLMSGNLNFLLDVAGPSRRADIEKDKAEGWSSDLKPLPGDFAKQFEVFCDTANFDVGKP